MEEATDTWIKPNRDYLYIVFSLSFVIVFLIILIRVDPKDISLYVYLILFMLMLTGILRYLFYYKGGHYREYLINTNLRQFLNGNYKIIVKDFSDELTLEKKRDIFMSPLLLGRVDFFIFRDDPEARLSVNPNRDNNSIHVFVNNKAMRHRKNIDAFFGNRDI